MESKKRNGEVFEVETRQVTVISSADLEVDISTSDPLTEGDTAGVEVSYEEEFDFTDLEALALDIGWTIDGTPVRLQKKSPDRYVLDSTGLASRAHILTAKLVDNKGRPIVINGKEVSRHQGLPRDGTSPLPPRYRQGVIATFVCDPTRDQALWALIRDRTLALSFSERSYKRFVDDVLCDPGNPKYAQYPDRLIGPAKLLGTQPMASPHTTC